MNLFELFAKISLDSSSFTQGLASAVSSGKSAASTLSGTFTAMDKTVASAGKKAINGILAAGTAASTAITKIVKDSVSAGSAFDASMSQVAATMGVTVDEIDQLRVFAQEMGATTAFSASQAADALNYMALAGYDAEMSMSTLPSVLNLAAAGGMELARASDMITDSQTALGLTLPETSKLVDKMAKTASKSNTSVSQLGDAILTIGSTARFMSGGTTELNAVLGILADNGMKSSEAGTHLRNMLLSLSDPTKEGASALRTLGVSVFDANGNMRQMQDIFVDLNKSTKNAAGYFQNLYASASRMSEKELSKILKSDNNWLEQFGISLVDSSGNLRKWNDVLADINETFENGALSDQATISLLGSIFNTRDVAAATSLMGTSVERWEELGAAIDDAAGAAEKMAKTQLDNLTGDVTLFKSALEGVQIMISDSLNPVLRGFVQYGTDVLGKLGQAFSENGIAGAVSVLGDVIGDLFVQLSKKIPDIIKLATHLVTDFIKAIRKNLPTLKTAAKEFISTFFNSLSSVVDELLPIIQDIVPTILEFIMEFQGTIRETGVKVLTALLQGIASNAGELAQTAVNVISRLIDTIAENLPLILDAGITIITTLARAIGDNLPTLIPKIVEIITTIVTELTKPESISNILNAAITLFGGLVTGLVDAIPKIVKQIPTIVSNVVKALTDNLPTIIEAGIDLFTALVDNVGDIVDSIATALPELIMGIINELTKPEFIEKMLNAGIKLFVAIVSNIPKIIGAMAKGIFTFITEFIKKLTEPETLERLWDVGVTFMTQLWEGLKQTWTEIASWFEDLGKGIANFFGIKIEVDDEELNKINKPTYNQFKDMYRVLQSSGRISSDITFEEFDHFYQIYKRLHPDEENYEDYLSKNIGNLRKTYGDYKAERQENPGTYFWEYFDANYREGARAMSAIDFGSTAEMQAIRRDRNFERYIAPQVINLQLDSTTVASVMYDPLTNEATQRGY